MAVTIEVQLVVNEGIPEGMEVNGSAADNRSVAAKSDKCESNDGYGRMKSGEDFLKNETWKLTLICPDLMPGSISCDLGLP